MGKIPGKRAGRFFREKAEKGKAPGASYENHRGKRGVTGMNTACFWMQRGIFPDAKGYLFGRIRTPGDGDTDVCPAKGTTEGTA